MSRPLTVVVGALGALLALAALREAVPARRPRVYGRTDDAFPFPTTASHEGIDLEDPDAVAEWCREFDCTEEQLRAAVRKHGTSAAGIRAHLKRTR